MSCWGKLKNSCGGWVDKYKNKSTKSRTKRTGCPDCNVKSGLNNFLGCLYYVHSKAQVLVKSWLKIPEIDIRKLGASDQLFKRHNPFLKLRWILRKVQYTRIILWEYKLLKSLSILEKFQLWRSNFEMKMKFSEESNFIKNSNLKTLLHLIKSGTPPTTEFDSPPKFA